MIARRDDPTGDCKECQGFCLDVPEITPEVHFAVEASPANNVGGQLLIPTQHGIKAYAVKGAMACP